MSHRARRFSELVGARSQNDLATVWQLSRRLQFPVRMPGEQEPPTCSDLNMCSFRITAHQRTAASRSPGHGQPVQACQLSYRRNCRSPCVTGKICEMDVSAAHMQDRRAPVDCLLQPTGKQSGCLKLRPASLIGSSHQKPHRITPPSTALQQQQTAPPTQTHPTHLSQRQQYPAAPRTFPAASSAFSAHSYSSAAAQAL